MALAAPSRRLGRAAVELVEQIKGRTLRRAEQAIDVLRLDQALEQAKDELEAAIFGEMVAATAAWKAGMATVPALSVTDRMVSVLDRLTEIGRQEALLELERLGYRGIQDTTDERRFVFEPAPQGRDVTGYLRRELPGIQHRIEDELVTADLSGASQTAIARALLRVPGARDIASRVISTALIDGIGMRFEDNQDLVKCWEYTAVLDAGTCSKCAPLDGKRYDSLQALFHDLPNFGPNPRCKGGGRCRCRAVPCAVDDVGQNEPEPTDAELAALPVWKRELMEKSASVRSELAGLDFRPGQSGASVVAGESAARAKLIRDFSRTTAGSGVPSEAMASVERDVLRIGELVDDEIHARAGEAMLDLNEAQTVAKLEVETIRVNEYLPLGDPIDAARRQMAIYNDQLRARLVAEIQAAEPDLSSFLVYDKARGRMGQDPGYIAQREALNRLEEQRREVATRLSKARGRLQQVEADRQKVLREATLEVLGDLREMGPGGEQAWVYTTKGIRGKAKERLESAGEFYPREWIERGRANPIKATYRDNGRGYHSPGVRSSDLVVSGGDRSKVAGDPSGFATAIHELGHHAEHVDPRLKALEWAFYQRRTRAAGYGLQEQDYRFPSGMGYGSRETYRPDGFSEKYMGKAYMGGGFASNFEVLTMGLESLWTGSYELDLEMRRFILGLLAGL